MLNKVAGLLLVTMVGTTDANEQILKFGNLEQQAMQEMAEDDLLNKERLSEILFDHLDVIKCPSDDGTVQCPVDCPVNDGTGRVAECGWNEPSVCCNKDGSVPGSCCKQSDADCMSKCVN